MCAGLKTGYLTIARSGASRRRTPESTAPALIPDVPDGALDVYEVLEMSNE
jgi:hypothetical protein